MRILGRLEQVVATMPFATSLRAVRDWGVFVALRLSLNKGWTASSPRKLRDWPWLSRVARGHSKRVDSN